MIIQPKREMRNVNDSFFQQHEAQKIAELNDVFGNVELTNNEEKVLIWLAGLDDYTVDNLVSAVKKAIDMKEPTSIHKKLEANQLKVKLRDTDRDTKQRDHSREDREER